MPQLIDRTDFNSNTTIEGFWTCLKDRIGAGGLLTCPKKALPSSTNGRLYFARQNSPISGDIRSEISRAKD